MSDPQPKRIENRRLFHKLLETIRHSSTTGGQIAHLEPPEASSLTLEPNKGGEVETQQILSVILIAIIISILSGFVLFGILGVAPGISMRLIAIAILVIMGITVSTTLVFYVTFKRYATERSLRLALMTLSEDERVVLEKIMENDKEIRQDDLWRKIGKNYSKSKLSALVNNLERKHAITKRRYGRTNILKLSDEFRR